MVITVKYVEGANVSCGCFGALDSSQINILTILRNIILIIWSFLLVEYFYFKKTSKGETHIEYSSTFINSSKYFYTATKQHFTNQNRKLKDIVAYNFVDYEGLQVGDILRSIKVNDLTANPIEVKITGSK